MPSRFSEFRFLDKKHEKNKNPQISFQAQKKQNNTWVKSSAVVTPPYTYQMGQIFVFGKLASWCATDWNEGQEKRVVARLRFDLGGYVEDMGYVIAQDPEHDQSGVEGVSLAVGPGPNECAGFLLTTDGMVYPYNVGDPAAPPDLEYGPWGSGNRQFLP